MGVRGIATDVNTHEHQIWVQTARILSRTSVNGYDLGRYYDGIPNAGNPYDVPIHSDITPIN